MVVRTDAAAPNECPVQKMRRRRTAAKNAFYEFLKYLPPSSFSEDIRFSNLESTQGNVVDDTQVAYYGQRTRKMLQNIVSFVFVNKQVYQDWEEGSTCFKRRRR